MEFGPPTIRGYSRMERIGHGGFADVYRAVHEHLDRAVAIKVLRVTMRDKVAVDQFRTEARALGKLDSSENILRVIDAGVLADGRPYLISELCDTSLHQNIANRGPLPPERVVEIGYRLTCGLLAAHQAEILHGDITPKNVLLRPSGAPVLADFGLAVLRDYGVTAAVGHTVAYAAPEILRDDAAITAASDVYGLGATLYHALAGHPPHPQRPREDSRAHALRILHEPAPDLVRQDIPPYLRNLVLRMLAQQPSDRPTPMDVAEALRGRDDTSPVAPPHGGTSAQTRVRHGAPVPAPAVQDHDVHSAATRMRDPQQADLAPSRHRRSWSLMAGLAGSALILTVGAVIALSLPGTGEDVPDDSAASPTTAAVPTLGTSANSGAATDTANVAIELATPVDAGDAVELSWTGPVDLNYGVVVAQPGQPSRTILAHRATTLRVPVDREVQYCFRVQGTDGRQAFLSNVQGIRGAVCRFP